MLAAVRLVTQVVCHEHARRRLVRDRAVRGLKVYDDREASYFDSLHAIDKTKCLENRFVIYDLEWMLPPV